MNEQILHNDSIKLFWARIITCNKTTGYATVKPLSGTLPTLTLAADAPTYTVFLNVNPMWRTGDDVLIIGPAIGVTPAYAAIQRVEGLFVLYAAPIAGELSATQDNPALDTYGADTVTYPTL